MNDDRQLRVARLPELPPEDALLHVARRVIVVVVEAHFAPPDHPRMPRQLIELRKRLLGDVVRVVRMNADGRVNPVMLLGKRNRCIEPVDSSTAADGKQRPHARRARALEHRLAIFVKLRKFQVRV